MSRGRKHVPVPAKAPVPSIPPPKGMSKPAAAEWRRTVNLLASAGVVSELDVNALTIYCNAIAMHRQAQEQIDKLGPVVVGSTGTPIKNPYLLVQKEAWERIKTLQAELGLTPSARAKLNIGKDDEAADDELKF
jgi:P27 family predicted phage terminase small subunit